MSNQERLGDNLFMLTMQQRWNGVVEIYKETTNSHRMKLTKSEDTAFHIAISSHSPKSPNSDHEKYTKKMIGLMKDEGSLSDVARMQNVRGDTPLHLAAGVGWDTICMLIAAEEPELIAIRNMDGETPLFLAAHHGNLKTFRYLHRIYNDGKDRPDESLCRRRDGNTILHSAISQEHLGLANSILEHYKNLHDYVNVMGETPLHVLARKPNLFQSSSRLGFYESIIYYFVFVDDDDDDDDLKKQLKHNGKDDHGSSEEKVPENYRTCVKIFLLLWNPIYKSYKAGLSRSKKKKSDVENPPYVEHGVPINESFLAGCSRSRKQNANPSDGDGENPNKVAEEKSKYYKLFPPNYITCISIFKFAAKVILIVLGIGFFKIREIHENKVQHHRAMKIMLKMNESETSYRYDGSNGGQRPALQLEPPHPEASKILGSPSNDEENETNITMSSSAKDQRKNGDMKSEGIVKDSPVLVAAKMGILEMVKAILHRVPLAIQDQDSEGKNVAMVAVENRQISVFGFLMQKNLPDYMFHHFDKQGNSILHLAAKRGEKRPWFVPGAALQMQWEINWYMYVKKSVPAQLVSYINAEGETPAEVFTRTHEDLVKAGTEWLIKTCEFCTVVAALIATVAFSTSTTVPGGLDDAGYPILKDQQAFDIFSIASLVGLCQSITALIFFFAIMISPFEERHFERDLPRKLLLGLTCLISSIAAMIVSFCAGHSFILRDKLRFGAVPIYVVAIIPITFFTIAQMPLYLDLLFLLGF